MPDQRINFQSQVRHLRCAQKVRISAKICITFVNYCSFLLIFATFCTFSLLRTCSCHSSTYKNFTQKSRKTTVQKMASIPPFTSVIYRTHQLHFASFEKYSKFLTNGSPPSRILIIVLSKGMLGPIIFFLPILTRPLYNSRN